MALTDTITALAQTLFTDTVTTTTVDTVSAASTIIYAIEIDNTANAAISYLRMWNTAGAVTNGTTVPDAVLPVPAGQKITYVFPDGYTFATGLKLCMSSVGGTTGTGAPTNTCVVEVAFT
jgi:hypothetical protein